jgi:hypothetical protein
MTVEACKGKALRAGLQMATSSRLLVKQWVCSPGGISCYLVPNLPHQQLNLFTIISSSRKFAECLYCDVSPPPILPILSRFIKSLVIYSGYSRTSYIHTFMHSYNHTFIH